MRAWHGYEHGINLGGWLSQCVHTREHYARFIGEEDIRTIAGWGLDHVRLPVDYEAVEHGVDFIDRAAEWCGRYGLNMVLDLHKTYGFSFDSGEGEVGFFDSAAYQEKFYQLWEHLAERYHGLGDRVAFELLNEVTDKAYSDAWNAISAECIRRIRRIAPETCILVGGYYNNSIEALGDLALPADDRIVYNFHCYEPLIFTHQGAGWIPSMDRSFRMTLGATYREMEAMSEKQLAHKTAGFRGLDPDATLSEAYFDRLFAEAVHIAEERNVPLYCGEYGVIDRAEERDVLRWYDAIRAAFERWHIGRAAWTYRKMDFGFVDEHDPETLAELVRKL